MSEGRRAPGLRWRGRIRKQVGHPSSSSGLHYDAAFLSESDRRKLLAWLGTIHPLWENRFSEHRPLPEGQTQRRLLRPVYWLGNWQFACLDYYRPPHGVHERCIRAEPFPPVLAALVKRIEAITRQMFPRADVPTGWKLNTCLINLYGRRREKDAWVDTARVGEHKDFEPGPVASLSLGERALFQFVESRRPGERDGVVAQQWLDDGSLQIFGGDKWKRRTFHRVQRVDHRQGYRFELAVEDFETRRINLTFRFVPEVHVIRFAELSPEVQRDVADYMETLAKRSAFFRKELDLAKT